MAVKKALLAIAILVLVRGLVVAQDTPIDRVFGAPRGSVKATTDDGQSIEQTVGDSVDAALDVRTEVPKEVRAGEPLQFAVTLAGDQFRSVRTARVEIDVTFRRGNAPMTDGMGGRIDRAVVEARQKQPALDCVVTTERANCTLSIDSSETALISGTITTRADAPAGQIVLKARALIGTAERSAHTASAALVAKRSLTDRGLSIGMEPDSDVGGPGVPFAHLVSVRNSSPTEDATDVVVEIRQRMGIYDRGKLRKPVSAGFSTRPMTGQVRSTLGPIGLLSYSCPPQKPEPIIRCTIPKIAAGTIVRFPLEITVLDELSPQRPGGPPAWGKIETVARVTSAENDPQPRDNVARTSTQVVSALPELVFVFQTTDASGNRRYEARDTVSAGEIFLLAARFMHVQVDPGKFDVQLAVAGGQPQQVSLTLPPDGNSTTYASGAFMLLSPDDKRELKNSTAVLAAEGAVVKVTYRGVEVAVATVVAR